ncbi:TonB-dependent receptor [Pseudoalteromonas sp. Scap03]|uniref:TonB-dependent receptor n=1 Tax=unclassified Pseudoalteromonas TaxID=194690 RepID=UPI0004090D06|nr:MULTISPECIES: TonB-dependent receptor [unclassified Pseudoalteromonas]NWL16900.1 TonB-dependent receptor [Pseudoalteromonas sp. Scap03]QLE82003.1 TonB-dependent receptor [Pseudoalteromonas sp. Scap25]QLE89947.1 TonB-dependent receptor [Pseudoalteromonas sp. Scap06]
MKLRTLSQLSLAVIAALTTSANAQEAKTTAKQDAFEKIEVTARKRTESLFESPTAITSIGANLIDKANMGNLEDIGKYVPNLNITRYGVGNAAHASVFIRGIGLQDHIITTDPGVGVYLDGVYLGRQMGSNLSLPNVERVEVLRGPQGTLYGRNTLGGAVNVITKQPGDEGILTTTAKVGSRGRVAGDIYFNNALTNDLSMSASASYKQRNGVGTAVNLANPEKEIGEEQEFSGRIALKYEATSDLAFTFSLDGVDNESGQSPYTIELTDSLDSNDVFNGDFPLLTEDLIPQNPDDLGTTVAGIESTSYSGWGTSFTADWAINNTYTAKFISSYRTSEYEGGLDDDASPLNLSEFPEVGGADQYSFELQLNATFDKMDFVSGLYFFNEDGFTRSEDFVFSPFNTPDGVLNDGVTPSFGGFGFFEINQETNSYAAYINGSYDLTDDLTIGGGLRYSEDKKDANAIFPTFPERKDISADFNAVTWDVNASYQLSNNMNVYGQVQKGYQTGGFPPRPFGGPDQFVSFDETKAVNYEIGLKGQVHENVSMMLAMFVTDYTDLALPFSDPTAGGGFVTIVENAGQSKAQGIELETTIALTDDFTIRTAVGYLDSEITEVAEGVQGIGKGDSPALTPRWTVMVAPSYFVDLSNGGTVALNANYSYRSEMQGQSVFNKSETIDSRELVGFNISYTNPYGDMEVTLYGENVLNEVYDVGRLQQTGFVGVMRSNDRSEFGLKFKKDFEL